MYVYTCTYTHVYTCTHMYIYTCRYMYVYTCTHMYIYTCIHMYIYTCRYMYVYTCTYTHVYTCMYTHQRRRSRSSHLGHGGTTFWATNGTSITLFVRSISLDIDSSNHARLASDCTGRYSIATTISIAIDTQMCTMNIHSIL